MKITLTKREQAQYDKLTSDKAKDNYLKAVELRRKADKLQRENAQIERKKDAHDKIVLGGIIVKVFGKLDEAQRTILLDGLYKEPFYSEMKQALGITKEDEEGV